MRTIAHDAAVGCANSPIFPLQNAESSLLVDDDPGRLLDASRDNGDTRAC